MKFVGFYNFGGGGTETITGGANENIPSFTENVCQNDKMFFSGQFSNLSRKVVHISLNGFGSAEVFHKHDLRSYESLNVTMIPLKSIGVHAPTNELVGFHGMGALWQSEDEDEYAVMGSKSYIQEDLHKSPDFELESYTRTSITTATTTTLLASASDSDFGLYKATIATDGANVIDLLWTDSSDGTIKYIGRYNFGGSGTFVADFDSSLLRNPNGQGGKIRAVTSLATNVTIDIVGHLVKIGQ